VSALTVTGAELDGERTGIRCEDGLIAGLGPEVRAADGDEVIDGTGLLLAPPFVSGHGHAAMTLFRGVGNDLPLMEWLEGHIWPAEKRLEPEDVYWGARLAAVEMLRSGTTRFFDMYWHAPETARAAEEAGIRGVLTTAVIDGMAPGPGELRSQLIEIVDRLGESGPLITPSLGPHAIYTVARANLEWVAEVTRERDLVVQLHLSETEQEVHDCVEANGMRPAFYLDEVGLLGPRTVIAHGVWLDEAELELIAERGATVVTNPAANMKLAVGGVFPYPAAAARGVSLGLGTDGVASNNNLDMLEEVKLLSLIQKHAAGDPSVLPAAEALEIARGRRSELMGGGPLAAGEPADFLLLRGDALELSAGELGADLVYAASGEVVQTVVVAGRVVMRDRVVPGADEVLAEVSARAARLTASR
jgi:5-methylthioadenosine/S-adenosylhomocysteine deaminase